MDTNDKDKKVTYNIPGVIIPPQTTENGVVISEEIDDLNVGNVINDTTKNTTTIQTENNVGKVVKDNNINNPVQPNIQPSIPTPVVPAMPYQAPVSQPVDMKVENKVETPVTNKSNGNNKKGKTPYLLIILILLAFIGYFVYNDYLKPKDKVDPATEWQRKRTANIDSLVVQQLYSYVNLDGCDDQIKFFYNDKESVSLNELTEENRNYLAYRQLKYSSIKKKNCSNYPTSLHKSDNLGLWYCGDDVLSSTASDYSDNSAVTRVISGDDIKTQVNRMFGADIYRAKTFLVSSSERYLYDSNTDSYILQSFAGENSCKGYTNKLERAYQQGDNLTIVVKVVNNENKKVQLFYYTFVESEDGNYYFNSLKKQNV